MLYYGSEGGRLEKQNQEDTSMAKVKPISLLYIDGIRGVTQKHKSGERRHRKRTAHSWSRWASGTRRSIPLPNTGSHTRLERAGEGCALTATSKSGGKADARQEAEAGSRHAGRSAACRVHHVWPEGRHRLGGRHGPVVRRRRDQINNTREKDRGSAENFLCLFLYETKLSPPRGYPGRTPAGGTAGRRSR